MSSDNCVDVEKLIAENEQNIGLVGYDEWAINLEKSVSLSALSTLSIMNPEVQVGGGFLDFSKQVAKILKDEIDHYATRPVGSINGKPWTVATFKLFNRNEVFNDFLAHLRETREKGFGFIFLEARYTPSALMFRDGTVIEKPSETFVRGHFYPLDAQ